MQSGQPHSLFCGTEEPFPLYCHHRSKEKSPAFVEKAEPKEAFSAKRAAGRRTKKIKILGRCRREPFGNAVRIAADKTAVSCKKAERSTFRNAVLIPKASVLLQKHYIEKRPDCQANFNFSRNMRKNKRVFCQISMKRRRSAGVRARSSAPARSSSCSPRNPQTQPMVCTSAFLPV